jgi:hypothetical protein
MLLPNLILLINVTFSTPTPVYNSYAASLRPFRYTQKMAKPNLQLRLVQGGCILFIVLCILLLHLGVLGSLEPAGREIKVVQFLIILGAVWSAVVGFTFQRKLSRTSKRPRRDGSKSTPFTRWKVGHLMRLASATSVGTWGLALYYFHGPLWLVDTVLTVALVLLIAWKPGPGPETNIADEQSPHP